MLYNKFKKKKIKINKLNLFNLVKLQIIILFSIQSI